MNMKKQFMLVALMAFSLALSAWAADFIAHVKRMTDVKLKSGTEAKPGMRVIRLESAAHEAVYDGFSYEVTDSEILIKGADDRGVAYALYELLERFGGCGWYSKTFDVVPDRGAVALQR